MVNKVRIIIIGAGRKARELIARLDKQWNLTVIDKNQKHLDLLKEINENIQTIQGDASSHLVLKEANIQSAQILVSLTDQDNVNFEIALLVKEKYPKVQFLTAVVHKNSLDLFKEHDIDALDVPSMISSFLINKIDTRTSIATDIGLGHGEIAEVTITGTSRVLNKKLSEIKPYEWVVGAIYRNNNLILPHGSTKFLENDRVLIISDPSKIHAIAEYISVGDYRFPLNFGNDILSVISSSKNWKTIVDESLYLLGEFHSSKIDFVIINDENKKTFSEKLLTDIKTYIKKQENKDNKTIQFHEINTNFLVKSIKKIYKEGSYGLVVLQSERFKVLNKLGVENTLHKLQTFIHSPIIISKGKFPYKNILISDRDINSPFKGFEIAISIAKKTHAKLEKITVKKPEFMEDTAVHYSIPKEQSDTKEATIMKLCKLYQVYIEQTYLEGNPVRKIKQHAKKKDLLIISQKEAKKSTFTSPSENQYLIHQADTSILIYNYGISEE